MAKLFYFANLVDKLGTGGETIDLPAGVTTVRDLLAWQRARGGQWQTTFTDSALHVTVNRQFASPDTPIGNQDEIAFIAARP